jgi:hypothetical protein
MRAKAMAAAVFVATLGCASSIHADEACPSLVRNAVPQSFRKNPAFGGPRRGAFFEVISFRISVS